MRIVVQTVKSGRVIIDNKIVGEISKGYLLLVGFTDGDNQEIVNKMIAKLLKLRIFADENGKTNLSIYDVNGDILSVSQFTLYADLTGGNRPSFTKALRPDLAKDLYLYFNRELEKQFSKKIETGIFGADMLVDSINDGPFTVLLDSKELFS